MTASRIADILKTKNSFAIVSHIMPDGDSIGSILALYNVLKRMGKDVTAYSSDKIPSVYSFLPGIDNIKYCSSVISIQHDVLVVLDCGSMDRTGECTNISNNAQLIINIDHHGTNSLFADFNLVDTDASATGELVYRIIKLMDIDILKDESVCIYTAILTDTGGFRYSNTTPETHQIAGELINTGINISNIYDSVYKTYKYENIKILGKVLSSIELYCDSMIGCIYLLKEDMKGINPDNVSTSDFIDYARDIDSVEVAVFVKEISADEFKLSFRSKHFVDVKAICEKYGGGGHKKAAGCTIKGNLSSIKESVIKELEGALKGDIS